MLTIAIGTYFKSSDKNDKKVLKITFQKITDPKLLRLITTQLFWTCYNANPSSMDATLKSFTKTKI